MGKITVKNISTSFMYLNIPTLNNWSRELRPGRVLPLTQEEFEELNYDPGFNALVNGHYVRVFGVDLGEDTDANAKEEQVFEKTDIEKMLDTLDITAFAKFIPTAAAGEKETVVQLAVDKGITNNAFVTLIKKYCNVDIINAISMKHQAEEK